MGYIPEEIIEEILHKTDIVQIISEYVLLKKRGKNYFGICPFHQEDTPSFSVTPDKQIFYCFGCNAGGNVLKFLMLKEGISYPEAIRMAGVKVGVHVPDHYNTNNTRESQERQRSYKIIATASKFFQQHLLYHKDTEARNYLQSRNISSDMIETFQIGYAPSGWNNLLNFLAAKGAKVDELFKLGLIVKSQQGTNYYDRFRNRVMLPIHDAAGRIVGFGGRTIDGGNPKYLNSPETPYFNKRHLLYGLHLARSAIRDCGYAVVMEGYLDVVAAHQYGIKNTVATLGTALTRDQVKLLMRYTDEIVISYDADAAGVQAAIRGLDIIQQLGCRVKVLHIPEGKDPDDFIRAHGVDGWHKLIKSAYNLIDFKLHIAFRKGIPTSVPEKISVLQEIVPNLSNIKNSVEQEESIKKVASALSLSWESVISELKRYQTDLGKKSPNGDKFVIKTDNNIKRKSKLTAREQAEFLLLGIILTDFELFSIVKQEIKLEHFGSGENQKIYSLLLKSTDEQRREPAMLMQHLNEKEQNTLSRLLSQQIPGENPVDILNDCIKIIKEQAGKKHQQQLLMRLKEAERAGDMQQVAELLQQLQQLSNTMNTDLP
ncbi:DNA primase [Peptococcaceae bacterium 1198_IL3148]